jgi:peptide-methionine (S)-S-oxide reductase
MDRSEGRSRGGEMMMMRLIAPVVLGSVLIAGAAKFPDPTVDPKPAAAGTQTAVLAGGCFWGVETVFDRIEGA